VGGCSSGIVTERRAQGHVPAQRDPMSRQPYPERLAALAAGGGRDRALDSGHPAVPEAGHERADRGGTALLSTECVEPDRLVVAVGDDDGAQVMLG
jgi:hypothetical protein